MTIEDITLLQDTGTRAAVDANIDRDPVAIALDKRIPNAGLVASQVKYLQRARRKLPSYYAARCILPTLAFEQSSSELAASKKNFSGELCIDLTCGLGVDSFTLSGKFDKVISVERDSVTAETARVNFARLGASNITVCTATAEDFLEEFAAKGLKADLVYVDPDRRSQDGKKQVRLEDCSPNVLALLPLLKKTTRRIAIKASPMFDVGEAFRLFGPHCRVDVISIANECKEVVIELSEDINVPMIRATAVGKGAAEYPYTRPKVKSASFAPPYRYMLVPDVALRKARITADWAAANLPAAYATPGDGYVFFNDPPSGLLLGKVFEIIHTWEYSPRSIKKQLKDRGIKSAEIMLHGFPRTAAQICRDLGIREGGDTKLAFTRIEGTLWTLELKELPLH